MAQMHQEMVELVLQALYQELLHIMLEAVVAVDILPMEYLAAQEAMVVVVQERLQQVEHQEVAQLTQVAVELVELEVVVLVALVVLVLSLFLMLVYNNLVVAQSHP
jgi:hypothetical protein